jgi:hypothetical protein
MTVELAEDERKFLQACYNHLCSDDGIDWLLWEIDAPDCERRLIEKGVLTSARLGHARARAQTGQG